MQNSDGVLTGKLPVTITITNIDERGEIELSSEQPQVGTPLTATLETTTAASPTSPGSGRATQPPRLTGPLSAPPLRAAPRPIPTRRLRMKKATPCASPLRTRTVTAQEERSGAAQQLRAACATYHYAPEFASPSISRDIAENTAAGENIGEPVTADDQNIGDILKYALEGTDSASFDIDSGTGQLKTKSTLNYEGKKTYNVTSKHPTRPMRVAPSP